jgi:hypothetical protein
VIDLSHLIDRDHVSQDLPFREIRNREIKSPGDKGSRLSSVDILEHLWTVLFKEVTCREITHSGNRGSGIRELC